MSLQAAIENAGSPMRLLWKPDASPWRPPVLPAEFVGWREEQSAGHQTVAFSDLSHHMTDTFIEGPDAARFLSEHTANDYEEFAIGQAKQIIPVTEQGQLVADGILARNDVQKFTLTSLTPTNSWMRYHAEIGDYDVSLTTDVDSAFRGGADPVLFRYQIQGPNALQVAEKAFGPIPKVKFFHSTPVSSGGRSFRALRHGMTGQPGFEFVGDWADSQYIKDALLQAGESFGLVQVGANAYGTLALISGWVPYMLAAIYTAPELENYRQWLKAYSFEGQYPLYGTYYSDDVEDYYCNPYELGYGKSISFNHDFIGHDALKQARDNVQRQKVTLVVDPEQALRICGDDFAYMQTDGVYRVEANDQLVGIARFSGTYDPVGTVLALALIDKQYATPGTEVTLVWGRHPGPSAGPDADLEFTRVAATVQPAPYDQFARTAYRKNS